MSEKSWWKSIAKTSSLIALSKVLGFVRDLILAAYFGTSRAADAFNFAYLFTGNIFILLGGLNGPFHSATVTTLGRIAADYKNSQEKQNIFLSNVLWKSILGFSLMALLLLTFMKPVFAFLLEGKRFLFEAVILQTQLMIPVFVLTGVIGILFGAVSFKGDYFWPSLSPLISSLSLILCIFLAYSLWGEWVLGIGTSLGSIIQCIVQYIDLTRFGFKLAPVQASGYEQHFSHILFPALLSSTVGSLNVYVDSFFCARLAEGSWTAILMGNRLIQLPFGVLVGASLVSFLPRISAMNSETPEFNQSIKKEISNLSFLLLPFTVLIFVLAEPGVRLLFERGEFNATSTNLVVLVLLGLAASLLTGLPREIYTRVFYALGDSRTPLIVSVSSIITNAVLDYFLSIKYGVFGIALSTTLTYLINSLALFILLWKKTKNLYFDFTGFWKLSVASALTCLVARFSFLLISSRLLSMNIPLKDFWICLSVAGICLPVYFVLVRILKYKKA